MRSCGRDGNCNVLKCWHRGNVKFDDVCIDYKRCPKPKKILALGGVVFR